MVQVVVVLREIWVERCRDGGRQGSGCCSIRPRCHQHQVGMKFGLDGRVAGRNTTSRPRE